MVHAHFQRKNKKPMHVLVHAFPMKNDDEKTSRNENYQELKTHTEDKTRTLRSLL